MPLLCLHWPQVAQKSTSTNVRLYRGFVNFELFPHNTSHLTPNFQKAHEPASHGSITGWDYNAGKLCLKTLISFRQTHWIKHVIDLTLTVRWLTTKSLTSASIVRLYLVCQLQGAKKRMSQADRLIQLRLIMGGELSRPQSHSLQLMLTL